MQKFTYYLKNPRSLGDSILNKFFLWLPDTIYVRLQYYFKIGRRLHLKNPRSYTEKLQWLKIYNRNPEYTSMVDKVTAKDYARHIIGDEYIIPTLGVWNNFDSIDFSTLPDKFVIKSSNGGGGGGVVICKDKASLNIEETKRIIEYSLKSNIYKHYREWPYKNVTPRIIAEQLLEPKNNGELNDYKFYCFNGVPKVMLISHGRFSGITCFDYYDMDFNLMPFQQGGPNSGIDYPKPTNFELMKRLAKKLSTGLTHARIDFYDNNGNVYFGEITFFDSSGYADFTPEKWNYVFGEWLDISKVQR